MLPSMSVAAASASASGAAEMQAVMKEIMETINKAGTSLAHMMEVRVHLLFYKELTNVNRAKVELRFLAAVRLVVMPELVLAVVSVLVSVLVLALVVPLRPVVRARRKAGTSRKARLGDYIKRIGTGALSGTLRWLLARWLGLRLD